MGRHNRHFRNVSHESSRRIEGFQDRSLEPGLKSPAWKLAEKAAQALNGPGERRQAHGHHIEIGGMAVFALEERAGQPRYPERLENIESPLD